MPPCPRTFSKPSLSGFPNLAAGVMLTKVKSCVAKEWRRLRGRRLRCVPWRSPYVFPHLCCQTHGQKIVLEALQDLHENAALAVRSVGGNKAADAYGFIHVTALTNIVLGDDWPDRLRLHGLRTPRCPSSGPTILASCLGLRVTTHSQPALHAMMKKTPLPPPRPRSFRPTSWLSWTATTTCCTAT